MEKWRYILLIGIVLGIAVEIMDFLIGSIPYAIIIPLQVVAIVLIFSGFIIRKREKNREK